MGLCFLLAPRMTSAQVVTTLAGSGAPGSADGNGTAATFYSPFGVAVDSYGNVAVVDSDNSKIRKIAVSGGTATASCHLSETFTASATATSPRS